MHDALFQSSWWMWAIPRIISSDRFRFVNPAIQSNGLNEAVALQGTLLPCELCYYYPCYYFYFYDDTLDGTNTIFESTEFCQKRNIFVLNILMHWAIPHLFYSLCTIVALGTPKWGRKAINYVINFDNVLLHSWMRNILRCNAYICYARIVWYYFVENSASLTSVYVILFCTAMGNHFALFSATRIVNLLEHKDIPRNCYRNRFVIYYANDHFKRIQNITAEKNVNMKVIKN